MKLSSPLDVRLEFSATCEFDFIRAFDDVDRMQQLGCRMCKDWSTPHPVMSTHDVMYVEFHSDFAVQEQGYMIGFTSANQTKADLAHQEAPPYYCDCKLQSILLKELYEECIYAEYLPVDLC